MTTRTIVTVVKTIQFRVEVVGEDGKVEHGWNTRYRSPHSAAENYTRQRIGEWEHEKWEVAKHGAAYHRQTEADRKYIQRLSDRFYRMVLPRFKKMLEPAEALT